MGRHNHSYVTLCHIYDALDDIDRIKMTAVVSVTETEDLDLEDVCTGPISPQPTEFFWHNMAIVCQKKQKRVRK